MASPTPSLNRTYSLSSLIDQNEYSTASLSSGPSPLTSSPTLSSSGSGGAGSTFAGILQQRQQQHESIMFPQHFENVPVSLCGICHDTYKHPRILPCLHTFCEQCLERTVQVPGKIACVRCHQECILSSQGVTSLLPDYTVYPTDCPDTISINTNDVCTNCGNAGAFSVAYCYDCNHFFCHECVAAHQTVNFDCHRVYAVSVNSIELGDGALLGEKVVACPRHRNEDLKYFCITCNIPICKLCTVLEHPSGLHNFEQMVEIGQQQMDVIARATDDSKVKASNLRNIIKHLDDTAENLSDTYKKAQTEINDTFLFYRATLEERKGEILKELESVFTGKQISIGLVSQRARDVIDKIGNTCDFVERLLKTATLTECLMFKKLLDSKTQSFLNYTPDINLDNVSELQFVSNYQAIQVAIRNTFGYIRANADNNNLIFTRQPAISRPNTNTNINTNINSFMMNNNGTLGEYLNGLNHSNNCADNGLAANGASLQNGSLNGSLNSSLNGSLNGSINGLLDRPYSNGLDAVQHSSLYDSTNILSRCFEDINGLSSFSNGIGGDLNLDGTMNGGIHTGPHYDKWSNSTVDIFGNGANNHFGLGSVINGGGDSVMDMTAKFMSTSLYPPKSQIKRQKMIYHCKFGEFGPMEGQFTEPSGVAVNAQNDIIVADTNNHRIQVFDKDGRFKFQFGECGKREGQLLYPNRVAVIKQTGDIIVTERSPTHQIQIYNPYGQFMRKFGANILQHPRGITVDNKGRIIVVECKVMRVIIFDQVGNILQKFGCSKHLEFPNGVVVNDNQEIFISDNRAHCVKVFNYEGMFLRQIGGEGITNYPIGVGINSAGEILIADNHNNFNLTIFSQDGQLVSALESKVKHAQCFDVALMDDGSVVLASKDYRLYIYRYLQVPPMSGH